MAAVLSMHKGQLLINIYQSQISCQQVWMFCPVCAELIVVKIPHDFSIPESCADLVEQLARVVYAHGNDNQKGQAMLCTVYFRCVCCCGHQVVQKHICMQALQYVPTLSAPANLLHAPCRCIRDDFYGARDTLLMSRIQEQTGQLDAKMQVCCRHFGRSSSGLLN